MQESGFLVLRVKKCMGAQGTICSMGYGTHGEM